MERPTLLGHLALRLGGQTENLATEALCYILNRSDAARMAFLDFVRSTGADLPDTLAFRTQATGGDGAIPDLVGEAGGLQPLIVEAKFWAGLTAAQPLAYLRRLDRVPGGALLFVAPSLRLRILWEELAARCEQAGQPITGRDDTQPDVLHGASPSGTPLVVVSWRAVLDAILGGADLDESTAADVRQLQGLCDRMDADAFLPLAAEELGAASPKRLGQFNHLVNELADLIARREGVSTQGGRAAGGIGYYGRPFKVGVVWCLVHFNVWQWAQWARTPLWFRVRGPHWDRSPAYDAQIRAQLTAEGISYFENGNGTDVALDLPLDVEKGRVVDALLMQLTRLIESVRACEPPAGVDSAPPDAEAPPDFASSPEPSTPFPSSDDQVDVH